MVLQAQSPAEGVYVRVHDDESAEDVVIFSTENRNVRRRMRFGDMNWAKKSRLHFKYKPLLRDAGCRPGNGLGPHVETRDHLKLSGQAILVFSEFASFVCARKKAE